MRRKTNYALYMLFVLLFCVLCGCKGKERAAELQQEKVPDVQYKTDNVTAFCVDEQGIIYTCEEGVEVINVYDANGTKLSEVAVDGGTGAGSRYTVLCAGEGVLYASDCEEKGIVEINIATGERELLYSTQDLGFWNLLDMTVCNDKLYFVYQKPVELAEMELLSNYEAGYNYIGERVVCLELTTKKAKEMEVPGVKRFCKKSDSELLFYIYDAEGGFSYRVYDTETGNYNAEYEAEQEIGLRLSAVMTYDVSMERLLYPDAISGKLRAIDITKKASETEFYDTGRSNFSTHSLQCVNGCTYFISDGKVTKINNSSYIMKNVPLKICSVSTLYNPVSGTGYEVNVEYLDKETMATKLLAGDSDFDLLILNSDYDLARQIERTGAYEPLNDIEGVETYLESCFDYISEAATAENGAIWMLPYEIDTRVLVYQPEVCEKYDVDFSGELTYKEFIDNLKKLKKDADEGEIYIEITTMCWEALRQYIATYGLEKGEAQFDTDLFRTFAPTLKELVFQWADHGEKVTASFVGSKTLESLREAVQKYYESYTLGVLWSRNLERKTGLTFYNGESYTAGLSDFDFFEARSMPSIVEGREGKGVAYSTFYVVNPNSERKEEAMEYLTVVAENLVENESIYRTEELKGEYSKLEMQVHDVYAEAEVFFDYTDDVMGGEYMSYFTGEISLEELIQEAERKFNIYLKE